MNGIDLFLVQYGLAAIFVILLVKTIGVPIPIPSDLIILTAAARAAQGKLVLWQALIAILIALVLGGLIQFILARGPGRGLLYRFGRYIGLTAPRLDAASGKVKKGGVVGISLAILVPGVRGAAIAASGLANMPLRTFLPGLVVGSALFPMSLLAGYYTTRASLAWVPIDHDERKILAYLEKFYRVARRYSGLKFDYVRVAVLELQYFDVHRQLSGNPEKGEFLQTLVDLHSAIFGLSPEQVRESAEWRLLAANTVDLITSNTSTGVEGDWVKLEEYLRRCYRSIQRELKIAKPISTILYLQELCACVLYIKRIHEVCLEGLTEKPHQLCIKLRSRTLAEFFHCLFRCTSMLVASVGSYGLKCISNCHNTGSQWNSLTV